MSQTQNGSELVKLSDLQPDQNNANRGTERGRYMLERSLEKLGAGRSILLDKNGKIIAGNKTAETAGEIGLEDVVIVRTDGTQLVAVMREDLDLDDPTGKARELAYADNRAGQVSLDFDPDVISADLETGLDLSDWFKDWELDELETVAGEYQHGAGLFDTEGEPDYNELPLLGGVPDAVWPTDNNYDIPLLDITRQADAIEAPVEVWGAKRRGTNAGTLVFYTEDYRFSAVWDNPDKVLETGCVSVVEPNFSVYKDAPTALCIWRTYQKRWLARYWQSQGARVFVDLNVAKGFEPLNLLGVPKGWQAYATRGYTDRLDSLQEEHDIATAHAAGNSILFLVYGGGQKVGDWCKANGALWVPEDMDRAKGRYLTEGVFANGER